VTEIGRISVLLLCMFQTSLIMGNCNRLDILLSENKFGVLSGNKQ